MVHVAWKGVRNWETGGRGHDDKATVSQQQIPGTRRQLKGSRQADAFSGTHRL